MSENFIRKYKLTIAGKDGKAVIITGQQIEFKISLDSKSKLNELDLKIYNLSADTISIFDKIDAVVQLEVGWGDNPLAIIFKGNKTFCTTKRESTEVITNVLAGEGAVTIRESRVQATLSEGSTVEQVIRRIIKEGMPEIKTINMNGDTLSKSYNRGYSAQGSAKKALDDITSANNLKWHIVQQDTLNVFPVNGDIGRKAIVLYAVNIKNTPEKLTEELRALGADKKAPKKHGINFKTQMNPLLVAGGLVEVKGTFNADGVYTIQKVEHEGDFEGNQWDTTLECLAYK